MERYVLGAKAYATCASEINRAFVVGDKDLRHFYEEGRNWVYGDGNGKGITKCSGKLRGTGEEIFSDAIETIANYTNPRKREIRAISVEMVSEDKNRTFSLELRDEEWPRLMSVVVGGPSALEAEKMFYRVEAEVRTALGLDFTWRWDMEGFTGSIYCGSHSRTDLA